ncbi:MAG: sodium:solute symporter family protein [Oscillospiraceae bacterium]|jgi:SSS family solute:Na+ symporter/sodium/proline symporter|nr:sodium:solute symporter family protein [Oscillospiraceae bacterium]
MVVTWITIGIYVAVLVVVALVSSRSSKSISDLTVGGRNMGAWLSALSYGTAYFSAVMFVGYAGSTGYAFGLWGVLAGLGNVVFGSLLAWLLLARRTRDISARLKLHTMPEFLETRYNSKALKLFSCVVIFFFLSPYSASVYRGLGSISQVLLGIDDTKFMIIIAVLSALLLVFGGYLVQARADFIQGIIMVGGVVLLIFFMVRSEQVGGLQGIAEYAKTAAGLPKLDGKLWWALLSLVFMTSFGTWGLPHMIQKYFGIRSDAQAKRGVWISTAFALLVAGGGYFIGSLCHRFSSDHFAGLEQIYKNTFKDYIIPTMLHDVKLPWAETIGLPHVLLGVVLVLLLAASVSTLCSVALTASSTLVMDFFRSLRPKTKEGSLKIGTKLVCVLFVALSYFIAKSNTPIINLMSYSWGIISGSFLAPYVLSLYFKGINKIGAWCSVLIGFGIAAIPAVCKIITIIDKTAAPSVTILANQGSQYAVMAMAASIVVCLLVSLIANGFKKKIDNPFFYEGTREEAGNA